MPPCLSTPPLRVLLRVLALRGRDRLIQQRQVEVPKVDELVFRAAVLLRQPEYPLRDVPSDPVGAGAADDDPDSEHVLLQCSP